jgi:hypothetical protein
MTPNPVRRIPFYVCQLLHRTHGLHGKARVVVTYGITAEKLKELYRSLRGDFGPTKRLWYAECDEDLITRGAPTDEGNWDEYSDEFDECY